MPNRYTGGSKYRYSFNGMEKDNEVQGDGNSLSTHFRQYDPRIARWTSIDPVTHEHMSPYNAFDGNPIFFSDPSGADSEGGPGDPPGAPENPTEGQTYTPEGAKTEFIFDKKNGWVGVGGTLSTHTVVGDDLSTLAKSETYKSIKSIHSEPTNAAEAASSYPKLLLLHKIKNSSPLTLFKNSEMDNIFSEANRIIYSDFQSYSLAENLVMSKLIESEINYHTKLLTENLPELMAKVENAVMNRMVSYVAAMSISGTGDLLKSGASLLTTKNGFLIGSIGFRTPVNINVGLYASQNTLKYGTFQWSTIAPNFLTRYQSFGRNMLQITPTFQKNLGLWSSQVIPKGTYVRFGFVGAQKGVGSGSWIQFYTPARVPFVK